MTDIDASTLVSVIVPGYNAAATIDATLRSARAQTHRALEIIVVDDGSKDDTAAVAERHAVEDSRVRVIRKPNGGVADARNAGIRASRGAFVAPLDADDLWRPEKIEKQLAVFRAGDPAMTFVYTLSWLIDAEDRIIGAGGFPGFEGHVFLRSVLFNFVGNASALLIRREAIDRIGGYDVSAQQARVNGSEDALAQALLARLGPVGVAPERLTGYRRLPGAMSTNLARMRQAQRWCVDNLRAAVPELPEDLATAALASIDARLAVDELMAGRPGAAARGFVAAARLAPADAVSVTVAYLRRIALRATRRIVRRRRAAPAPLFLEADPTTGADWVDPPAALWRARRLAPRESAFAARCARVDLRRIPLGLEGSDRATV